MVYFLMEESPYQPGKYMITPNFPLLPLKGTRGSYNILAARIMNLTYADFLRLCRDLCGAEIVGKGHGYPVAYFDNYKSAQSLIDELNRRTKILLEERKQNGIR